MSPPSDELQEKLTMVASYADELDDWLANPPEPARPLALERILERLLQVIVECSADAGDLWLAANGRPLGGSVRGVFQRLREAGVLAPELERRFTAYTNTRNRIVHAYNHLDPGDIRDQAGRLAADARAFLAALVPP